MKYFILYSIPVDSHNTVSHIIQCEQCNSVITTNASRYSSVAANPCEIDELVQATFPNLSERYRVELGLRDRLRSNQLSRGERLDLIRDKFTIMEPFVRLYGNLLAPLPYVGVGCFISILTAFVLAACIAAPLRKKSEEVMGAVGAISTIGLGILSIPISLSLYRSKKRKYFNGTIYPLMGRMLKPLNPTREELVEVFKAMEEQDLYISRRLDVDTVLTHIE